ncbi:hypothetical protein KW785_00480 [Candidatus Parcubacteria bacterium]|nr:hypothetical protein [Candidatus Parcubacteria bacterium]
MRYLKLGIMFLVVLHVASVFLIAFRHIDPSPVQDSLEYRLISQSVVANKSFSIYPERPDLLRGPLYPIFLAATSLHSIYISIFLQALLLLVTAYLLLKILLQLGVSERYALLAIIFFLAEPYQWLYSLQTMSEILGQFLFTLVVFLMVRRKIGEEMSPREFVLAGVVFGLLVLAKPSVLIWALAPLACISISKNGWKWRMKSLAAFLLSLILVVSPWLVRNFVHTEEWLLSSSQAVNSVIGFGATDEIREAKAGEVIYDSKGRAGIAFRSFSVEGFKDISNLSKEVVERRGLLNLIGTQLRWSPRVWFGHEYARSFAMLGHRVSPVFERAINFIDNFVWTLAALMSVLGIWSLYRQRKISLMILLTLPLFLTIFINLNLSYPRMLVPLYPVIVIVSILGINMLLSSYYDRVRISRRGLRS